jgi:hypothetical protein
MNSVAPSAISNNPGLAATAPVNAPFSCPNNQHRFIRRGGFVDQPEDFPHRRRLAGHLGGSGDLLDDMPQLTVLVFQDSRPIGALNQQVEFIEFGRLGQEVERPLLHRLDGVFDRTAAGQHDDFHLRVVLPDPLEQFDSREPWHVNVDHRHVEASILKDCQPGFPVLSR